MKENMKILKFQNPIFHDGLNCTVRQGYKWANLKIGETILLNGERKATIEKISVLRFKDVKVEDIRYEHDPKCRTTNGLFKVLSGIYPDFDIDTVVTIIHFKLIKS